jgi:hypothetical protein
LGYNRKPLDLHFWNQVYQSLLSSHQAIRMNEPSMIMP